MQGCKAGATQGIVAAGSQPQPRAALLRPGPQSAPGKSRPGWEGAEVLGWHGTCPGSTAGDGGWYHSGKSGHTELGT